jgi:hypothetical protein
MIDQFNHRFATYVIEGDQRPSKLPEASFIELESPTYSSIPYYWLPIDVVQDRFRQKGWKRSWVITWRDVTNAASERTVRSAITPAFGHADSASIFLCQFWELSPAIVGALNSFVFDFVARQKIGGLHLRANTMAQLALVEPRIFKMATPWMTPKALFEWVFLHVLELTYTAWDLEEFAKDFGYDGPPFRWDEERRFLLRCELDAAYFHLYGIARDDVDYIMETFPIVKRNDIKQYGDYRTKLTILDIYDRMQKAMDTGEPYQTLLDPPPADPRVAHPPRTEG